MKQKWKPIQFVEISMHEIFCFQDKLDAVKDNPEKVWEVVDDFFLEIENQLELSPKFIKELQELDLEKDFVPISIDEIGKICDDEDFDSNYATAVDYVNYVLYLRDKEKKKLSKKSSKKKTSLRPKPTKNPKYDIPFVPRHDF